MFFVFFAQGIVVRRRLERSAARISAEETRRRCAAVGVELQAIRVHPSSLQRSQRHWRFDRQRFSLQEPVDGQQLVYHSDARHRRFVIVAQFSIRLPIVSCIVLEILSRAFYRVIRFHRNISVLAF
jgi:hypothetical protein